MLDDEELSARIAEIEGRQPNAAKLRRARKLFAEALETPGGLKIQTIHAFCESSAAPVPAGSQHRRAFRDARSADGGTALRREARREMLTGAGRRKAPGLAEAFAAILEARRRVRAGSPAAGDRQPARRASRDFIDRLGGDTATYGELFRGIRFPRLTRRRRRPPTHARPLPGFSPETLRDDVSPDRDPEQREERAEEHAAGDGPRVSASMSRSGG